MNEKIIIFPNNTKHSGRKSGQKASKRERTWTITITRRGHTKNPISLCSPARLVQLVSQWSQPPLCMCSPSGRWVKAIEIIRINLPNQSYRKMTTVLSEKFVGDAWRWFPLVCFVCVRHADLSLLLPASSGLPANITATAPIGRNPTSNM